MVSASLIPILIPMTGVRFIESFVYFLKTDSTPRKLVDSDSGIGFVPSLVYPDRQEV